MFTGASTETCGTLRSDLGTGILNGWAGGDTDLGATVCESVESDRSELR